MFNAEHILRKRGLPKRRISRKARLIHHVYTWQRLVGESTYVLHDYPSNTFLEALKSNFRAPPASAPAPASTNERNPRLDDFLRLEAPYMDSDLNIHEHKDKETGLHDIHLQDSRSFPDTLYKQIYGIPETWLSLVSQTTRLANVMDTFRIAQVTTEDTSLGAWETLYRRSVHLENMICSLDVDRTRGAALDQHINASKPHGHMLRALNAALVIFFHRRVRRAHPAILASHASSVITSLEEFSATLPHGELGGPGVIWPAFIAGCETLAIPQREAVTRWLDKAESVCGFAAIKTARDIMGEVWGRQDEHLAKNPGALMPTWVDVVKERKQWPLFC
jgi:arginine metabolism regulation protein II